MPDAAIKNILHAGGERKATVEQKMCVGGGFLISELLKVSGIFLCVVR